MVLIIAILNDGTIMTISKDRVKPSPLPDSWKLSEIFTTGIVLGGYLAMITAVFFWTAYQTNFFPVCVLTAYIVNLHTPLQNVLISELLSSLFSFQRAFGVASLAKTSRGDSRKLSSAVYLQVSTISQALIFVTRARRWSFMERPGFLLMIAFLLAQLVSNHTIPLPFLLSFMSAGFSFNSGFTL